MGKATALIDIYGAGLRGDAAPLRWLGPWDHNAGARPWYVRRLLPAGSGLSPTGSTSAQCQLNVDLPFQFHPETQQTTQEVWR